MHNGYCAKWKCETTSSTTAGSCSGNYTTSGECKTPIDRQAYLEDLAATCEEESEEVNCKNLVYVNGGLTQEERSYAGLGRGKIEVIDTFAGTKKKIVRVFGYQGQGWYDSSFGLECTGTSSDVNCIQAIYSPRSGITYTYDISPRPCEWYKAGSQSCAGPTTESDCKAKSSSCTRTPPSSSSSSSLKCYRQGTTAAVADSGCATLTQPQC